MSLASVDIRHYKSLGAVSVQLDPRVTILVGPNASGKSNFVDALRFLRDAVVQTPDHAITQFRGGIAKIRSLSVPTDAEVTICAHFSESAAPDPGRSLAYELGVANRLPVQSPSSSREGQFDDPEGTFSITHEACTWTVEGVAPSPSHPPGAPQAISATRDSASPRWTSTQLALHRWASDHATVQHLVEDFRRWHFSTMGLSALKALRGKDPNIQLSEDGINWASLFRKWLHAQGLNASSPEAQTCQRIDELMRGFLPDYGGIHFEPAGGLFVPKMMTQHPVSEQTPLTFIETTQGLCIHGLQRTLDFDQLSDGTLHLFGLLLALYQVPRPSLLVIEEPERMIHPGALALLSDAIHEASLSTQIVITTHSPELINHFDPSQIRVVHWSCGFTHIGAIKQSQKTAVQQGLMRLGEFMQAEGLQAEAQALAK